MRFKASLHTDEAIIKGVTKEKVRSKKKRAASDLNAEKEVALEHESAMDKTQAVYDDPNELTMGEKLAKLDLVESNKAKPPENTNSPPDARPPRADSIHVLLKQALQADDRTLLVDCLYRQDEKVIMNSVSQLNPSDVVKLLLSLVPIVETRGSVLAHSIPWLRTLLLQHASGIMSHESSLLALNTLYQLIESRISTFSRALQLSSCLDLLYAGRVDDEEDENETIIPAIYEDKGESDEDGDAMETGSEDDDEPKSIRADDDVVDNETMIPAIYEDDDESDEEGVGMESISEEDDEPTSPHSISGSESEGM